MSTYREDIFDTFKAVFRADRKRYIRKWMSGWDIQDKARFVYDRPENFFYSYNGPEDLAAWMKWNGGYERPDYFADDVLESLIALSRAFDQKLVDRYGLDYTMEGYDGSIGRNNAQDYLLTNAYPVPERYRVRRLLDFGAGFGRQANLWTRQRPDIQFVGMDAIPRSYCLQHLYYSNLELPLTDYIVDPGGFSLPEDGTPGIFHVPSWRSDLLPDNSFDMVMCVQVLQEINGTLVRYMLKEFHRILKPGGALYIRDHDQKLRPCHGININTYLETHGFTLEFRPHIVDKEDLQGIPRIWRKTDLRVPDAVRYTAGDRARDWGLRIDPYVGGMISKKFKERRSIHEKGSDPV